jgi:VPDSG-CTERM motif
MKKLKYIAPILIAVACFGLQQAKADIMSFDLVSGNSAISGYPGPYATVSINRTDATHATITFTAYAGYLIGAQGSMGVNVNAGSWGVSALFNNGTGALSNGGANTENGFGMFNQTFDTFDGFPNAGTIQRFTLTNLSGNWASAAAVLTLTANGYLAAAHIFAGGANGSTGYAADGTVPDGGTTVMLLGAALGALGMARRFIKS